MTPLRWKGPATATAGYAAAVAVAMELAPGPDRPGWAAYRMVLGAFVLPPLCLIAYADPHFTRPWLSGGLASALICGAYFLGVALLLWNLRPSRRVPAALGLAALHVLAAFLLERTVDYL